MASLSCPFCGLRTPDSYEIALHIEQTHIDDSPFAIKDELVERSSTVSPNDRPVNDDEASLALARELQATEEAKERRVRLDEEASHRLAQSLSRQAQSALATQDNEFPYAECQECSEYIHLAELNEHINLHSASGHSLQEADSSKSIFNKDSFSHNIDHDRSLQDSTMKGGRTADTQSGRDVMLDPFVASQTTRQVPVENAPMKQLGVCPFLSLLQAAKTYVV